MFIHLFFIHALSRSQPTAVAPGFREQENGSKSEITNKSLVNKKQNFQVSKSETEISVTVKKLVPNQEVVFMKGQLQRNFLRNKTILNLQIME